MKTWKEWIDHHAAIFPKFRADDGISTLASWCRVFSGLGATPTAMGAASLELAGSDVPSWPEDQLRFLASAARRCAATRAAKPGEAPDPGPPGCRLCASTGYASVPNAGAMEGGPWTTVAVYCKCDLGRWKCQRHVCNDRNGVPLASLEDYEDRFPGWREALARHDEGLADWAAAQAISVSFGKSVGRVVATARRRGEASSHSRKEPTL
ncbi:MAG: hypothetical protein LC745_07790 [Planctomycetia bacterium]|nr:hypothetical protein [Planctomycetia bacterium]